jgi:hypothetical protein
MILPHDLAVRSVYRAVPFSSSFALCRVVCGSLCIHKRDGIL